jgi:general secretion pathway protein D
MRGIEDGLYFSKDNKGAFSKSGDGSSGRISVGISSPEGEAAKGAGKLLTVKLRALKEAAEAKVGLIAVTPIGAEKAVPRPGLPLSHMISILAK